VLFAAIQRWFPSRLAYHVLPFLLAGAFALISVLPRGAAGPAGGPAQRRVSAVSSALAVSSSRRWSGSGAG
jgi:hypothetical protein